MEHSKTNSDDSVYQKLKNGIRKRDIKQGSQLVEITLARQFGVSRTPIRSAIKKLEAEGLVNTVPNRGAFIITPTRREIKETFQVRSELEQMAAGLAASFITDQQVDELNRLIQKETRIFNKTDLEEYYILNDTFHLAIAEISGNKVLHSHIRMLLDRTRLFLILFDPFCTLEFSPTLQSHQAIVDALAERAPQKARDAVRDHVRNTISDLENTKFVPADHRQ